MSPPLGSVKLSVQGCGAFATSNSHAVKALIYDSGGRLLLQQRDDRPDLLFPGCWTFFGGLVEEGENWVDALHRELTEELGCCPGVVAKELFSWAWDGVDPALNHIYPVRLLIEPSGLSLKEGQAMGWFSRKELDHLKVTPLVTDNFDQIFCYLDLVVPQV